MKIEKISDNQIRCTLNKEDLDKRHLKISELAYGSTKARELFDDLLKKAAYEFGFEAHDIPLMIEAIPVSAECIVLILTKVDEPEELDTRFSDFSPNYIDDDNNSPWDEYYGDSAYDYSFDSPFSNSMYTGAGYNTKRSFSATDELSSEEINDGSTDKNDEMSYIDGASLDELKNMHPASPHEEYLINKKIRELQSLEPVAPDINDSNSLKDHDNNSNDDDSNRDNSYRPDSSNNDNSSSDIDSSDTNSSADSCDKSAEELQHIMETLARLKAYINNPGNHAETDTAFNDNVNSDKKNLLRHNLRCYSFDSFDNFAKGANIVNSLYTDSNTLYKNPDNNRYYLVLSKSECSSKNFNKTCNILSEYGSSEEFNETNAAYFVEHYNCIIKSKAIEVASKFF